MTTSKTIAGLMGPTLVAIAAAMVLNFASFPELAEQVARDPGLIFLSGILLFVAGLAIVRVHNVWVGGWPVLVTVLGWVAVLSGLLRMLFPTQLFVPSIDRPRRDVSTTDLRVGQEGASCGHSTARARRAGCRSRLGWRLLWACRCRVAGCTGGLWQLYRALRCVAHEPVEHRSGSIRQNRILTSVR
jgi:hypothetical protein